MRDPKELALARESLKGYAKAAPGQQRDPMPWEACVLLAQHMARWGTKGRHAARALVVAFDGYLRPSEALSIMAARIQVTKKHSLLPYPPVTVTLAPQRPDDGFEPAA
eukprot:3400971-Lingulodinium_polyedra.AAC.1